MRSEDCGPLTTYEIKWISERIERVEAHDVRYPLSSGGDRSSGKGHIRFYAVIDGEFTLVLSAQESDIRVIRPIAKGRW